MILNGYRFMSCARLSLARHRQKETFCLGGVAIAPTRIHRFLFQAELRFDRRPVPLQVDECLEVGTSEKGVGRTLQADRGARARTVIVSGPDGGRVWQALEQPLKTRPLGARIIVPGRTAHFPDKEEVASEQDLPSGFKYHHMIGTVTREINELKAEAADFYQLLVADANVRADQCGIGVCDHRR